MSHFLYHYPCTLSGLILLSALFIRSRIISWSCDCPMKHPIAFVLFLGNVIKMDLVCPSDMLRCCIFCLVLLRSLSMPNRLRRGAFLLWSHHVRLLSSILSTLLQIFRYLYHSSISQVRRSGLRISQSYLRKVKE